MNAVDSQGDLHKRTRWTQTENHTWSVTMVNPNGDLWHVNNGTRHCLWAARDQPPVAPTLVSPGPVVVVEAECVGGVVTDAGSVTPPAELGGGIDYTHGFRPTRSRVTQ